VVISLINNKGGVAKTTSSVNLSAALAAKGHQTLLIDLDSQCSASLSLGLTRDQLAPSSADMLLTGTPITEAIRTDVAQGLDLLPASIELASTDLALSTIAGREEQLRRAIEPVRSRYEYIITDCPPSLSLLSVNAILASDYLVIPVTPHYLALEGLSSLLENVEAIRAGMNTAAAVLGILLCMVDYRARVTREIVERIRDAYGDMVFTTEIRTNTRLAEAPSHGLSIFSYDNTSTGAHAYRALADEVEQRTSKRAI
jgi:chromosome partitioning protein